MTMPFSLAHIATSANLIDGAIAIALLELGVLLLHRRLTGGGIAPRDYLANLLSGLCLMAALRCAVTDAATDVDFRWVAAWLLAAGGAHAADMLSRLRRSAPAAELPHGVNFQ